MNAASPAGAIRWHWRDVAVAIAVAGLLIPESVAYADLARLPPASGLVAACVGLLAYALLGGSRFAIVSATSSSAIVLAAGVSGFAAQGGQAAQAGGLVAEASGAGGDQAAALVLLVGLLFAVCAALRLGQFAHFIARPVVRGMALGLALVIVLRQFASVAGVGATHANVFLLIAALVRSLPHWDVSALVFAAGTLLLLEILQRWPKLPATLLAIVAALLANHLLSSSGHAVPVVGPIDVGSLQPRLPRLAQQEWLRLAELAVPLALLLFAESYGSIRTFALRHGEVVRTDRDLLALAVANIGSSLLRGMPAGAGYSATSANEAAGAQSRAAGLLAAAAIVACLWLLLPQVEAMPHAALAAIIVHAMRHALSIAPLRQYFHWRRDRLVSVTAVVMVLVFGVVDGLLAAMALSLALLLRGLAQPRLTELGQLGDSHDFISVETHPEAHRLPGVVILRPEEPLFFANVSVMLEQALARISGSPPPTMLLLSLEESPDLDGTVIEALEQFAARLRERRIGLRLARLKAPAVDVLRRSRLAADSEVGLYEGSVATCLGPLLR